MTDERLTAVEVLRAIPDHLDTNGWCQGNDHNDEGAACLRGAINDLAPAGPIRGEVNLRLVVHVGGSIVSWNDRPGRTVEEVKEAVLAAADADLGGADLGYADLGDVNLAAADLRDANLTGVNLANANLRAADLAGANLRDANLRDANLWGANLTGARYTLSTRWPAEFDPKARGAVEVPS